MSLFNILTKGMLRLTGFKKKFRKNIHNQTNQVAPAPLPGKYKKEFEYRSISIDGREVFSLSPRTGASPVHILYIHGGAYVNNIAKQHWDLIAYLIKKTGASFLVPDYPLAPQSTARAGFDFLEKTYAHLLSKVPGENVLFMGDSAGGGFALAMAQLLRKKAMPQPSQIILISPWLDVTMAHPQIPEIEKRDVMLDVGALKIAGKQWAGSKDVNDAMISPINGPMDNLGKLALFIGTDDVFLADSRKFKTMLKDRGIPLSYYEFPKMFHVWVAATFLKEAKQALDLIAKLILSETENYENGKPIYEK